MKQFFLAALVLTLTAMFALHRYLAWEERPLPPPDLQRQVPASVRRALRLACLSNAPVKPGIFPDWESEEKQQVWVSLYGLPGSHRDGTPYTLQLRGQGTSLRSILGQLFTKMTNSRELRSLFNSNLAEDRNNDESEARLKRLRIKADFLSRESRIAGSLRLVRDFSLLLGLDGIVWQHKGKEQYILPDEFIEAGIQEKALPGNVRIGLNLRHLDRYSRFKWKNAVNWNAIRRFRTRSWIECGTNKKPKEVYRANLLIPRTNITSTTLSNAVMAAGRQLRNCIRPSGRFQYLYYPVINRGHGQRYNWVRHGGTVWMLLRIAEISNRTNLEAEKRALDYFIKHKRLYRLPRFRSNKNLYNLAVGLLSMLAYRRAGDSREYDQLICHTRDAVIALQDAEGMFHLYPKSVSNHDPQSMPPYAPGEAMLGLASLPPELRTEKSDAALRKGLDFIANDFWNFVGSRIFFGFFSWEMQAINRAWQRVPDPDLAAFCFDQAEALLIRQLTEEWPAGRDWKGGFKQTIFSQPKAAHVGARGEGIMAAIQLAEKLGKQKKAATYREAMRKGVRFILNQQIRDENSYYYTPLALQKTRGAIRYTPVFHEVRIDHTQHCTAVLLEAWQMGLFD